MTDHPIRILKPYEFDTRLIERHLQAQVITPDEYKQYLADLPDMADNAKPLIIDDEDQPAEGTEEA